MADAGRLAERRVGEARLLNFHDTVMNANLLMGCMVAERVADEDEALVERRWRFERLWLAMLYVVLESWRSKQMAPVRALVDSVVGTDRAGAAHRRRRGRRARRQPPPRA